MEDTSNFAMALATARAELHGIIDPQQDDIVARLFKRRAVKQMRAVHRQVRAMYAADKKVGKLDWSNGKLVQWIKDNWPTILQIIITVAPLLI